MAEDIRQWLRYLLSKIVHDKNLKLATELLHDEIQPQERACCLLLTNFHDLLQETGSKDVDCLERMFGSAASMLEHLEKSSALS